jgi:putative membrane protein
MRKTVTRFGIAVACSALMAGPGFAQSGSGTGTGAAGSGATDQAGSQPGSASGTGTSGTTKGDTIDRSKPGRAGQEATSPAKESADNGSSADRTFMADAAAGGMAEVELGKLAAEKASQSDVKQYAQMLVDDHSTANATLAKITRDKGFAVPPHALKPQDQAIYDRLSKLSGDAFDRAYIKQMVEDHEKDIAEFRKESARGADADVKQFAASTLPTLEKHLEEAKTLQGKLGGATATSGKKDTGPKDYGTSGASGSDSSSGTPPASGATPPRF